MAASVLQYLFFPAVMVHPRLQPASHVLSAFQAPYLIFLLIIDRFHL